jgi:N-hydroxyarylamine O-acetyltransferase
MSFDREAYLNRIGLDGGVAPTEAGLEELHRAQVFTLPFENFDIHLGRGVSLEPDRIIEKLVHHRRGGYCFELNNLFGMALEQFGFKFRPLLARVQRGGRLLPRLHLLNLVELGGRNWISDVGFGSNQPRAPMPLELDRVAVADGYKFRFVDGGNFGSMLQTDDGAGWQNLYSFDMEHVWPIDIELGNYFTSTHPDIFFTQVRVAMLPTPTGQTTLMDYRLRETSGREVTETILETGPAYLQAIEDKFGIVIDEPYEALKPIGDEPVEPRD